MSVKKSFRDQVIEELKDRFIQDSKKELQKVCLELKLGTNIGTIASLYKIDTTKLLVSTLKELIKELENEYSTTT